MARVACLVLAMVLAAGTDADEGAKLAVVLAQFFNNTNFASYEVVQGVVVDISCTDDSSVAHECHDVVTQHLCNDDWYYAQYCCRTCTLAGQLPLHGNHIGEDKSPDPPTVETSESRGWEDGSDAELHCSGFGYPQPDIIWWDYNTNQIVETSDRLQIIEAPPQGLVMKNVSSTLIFKNFSSVDPIRSFQCMAINYYGYNSDYVHMRGSAGREGVKILVPALLTEGQKGKVVCEGRTTNSDHTMTWSRKTKNHYTSRWQRGSGSTEEREENGWRVLTTTYEVNPSTTEYVECMLIDKDTRLRSQQTLHVYVRVRDDEPRCNDTLDLMTCYKKIKACSKDKVVRTTQCCRSCALYNGTDDGPWEVNVTAKADDAKYGDGWQVQCIAEYPQMPLIVWYKDGRQVHHGEGYDVTDDTTEGEDKGAWASRVSTLTVDSLQVRDTGNYTCVASLPGDIQANKTVTLTLSTYGRFAIAYV